MVSRSGEMPSKLRVECPKCGAQATVGLQYAQGETSDYDGACLGELKDGRPCGTWLLLTVTMSEEATK
jgi:hypothetical protein